MTLSVMKSLAELEAGLDHVRAAPVGRGRLDLIVRRPGLAEREVLPAGELDPDIGLVGDTWNVRPSKRTPDGSPHPLKQLNIMGSRAATVIAGDVEHWPPAGDQLFVDLHLGEDELPAGSQLHIGGAVIEVTDSPHTGCAKFVSRYGKDAMRFVNSPAGRALNLRGICARVLVGGTIRLGDEVIVSPGPQAAPASVTSSSSRSREQPLTA